MDNGLDLTVKAYILSMYVAAIIMFAMLAAWLLGQVTGRVAFAGYLVSIAVMVAAAIPAAIRHPPFPEHSALHCH